MTTTKLTTGGRDVRVEMTIDPADDFEMIIAVCRGGFPHTVLPWCTREQRFSALVETATGLRSREVGDAARITSPAAAHRLAELMDESHLLGHDARLELQGYIRKFLEPAVVRSA